MTLLARCDRCGTTFRVVLRPLNVSDGCAQCGHCGEIFNAAQHLVAIGSAEGGSEANHRSTHVGPKATPPVADPAAESERAEADRQPRLERLAREGEERAQRWQELYKLKEAQAPESTTLTSRSYWLEEVPRTEALGARLDAALMQT